MEFLIVFVACAFTLGVWAVLAVMVMRLLDLARTQHVDVTTYREGQVRLAFVTFLCLSVAGFFDMATYRLVGHYAVGFWAIFGAPLFVLAVAFPLAWHRVKSARRREGWDANPLVASSDRPT